jgi:hypothetical protein
VCSLRVSRGTKAWDGSKRRIICPTCAARENGALIGRAVPNPGVGGASAHREAERRRERREQQVRNEHPLIGDLMLRLSTEPQHIRAFDIGAAGEELVARRLDSLFDEGVIALHDRRRLRGRGNIDHIAIAPSGVYVIDSKRYEGRVRKDYVGGLVISTERLSVRGRDRTNLARKVREQAAEVGSVLTDNGFDVVVRPTLCFVEADWGLFGRQFVFDRVLVTHPTGLAERLLSEKVLSYETICRLAELLDQHFPPS